MGARLKIEAHLTQDEIRGYFLTSEDTVEQTRWQVVLLLSEGVKSEEVARIVGYCVPWVRELAGRYNREGAAAMRDGRHENPGAAPLLEESLRQELAAAVAQPPEEGGVWSGPRVAAWMQRRLGQKKVHPQRGWDYMRRLGFTPQRPRPKHPQGDPAAQESFPAPAAATPG
jgi:transposase